MNSRFVLIIAIFLLAQTAYSTENLYLPEVVSAFYQARNFQNTWTDPRLVEQLREAISTAPLHGLRPDDYHFQEFTGATDWLLTDAFVSYAHDLRFGRASHRLKGRDWNIAHNDFDLIAVLEKAVSTGRIFDELGSLAPSHQAYRSLQKALVEYRELLALGGWPAIGEPIDIEKPKNAEQIEMLRLRLTISNDLQPDMELRDAVIRFQRRHGLHPDGIVGKQTIAALSVTAEERVAQIELNLERLRWMPRQLAARFIVVNVPGFELGSYEQGTQRQISRVIVGKASWCTPTFLSSHINEIVFHPYWYVPSAIAIKEIYPLMRKNPGYLNKNNIRMIRRPDGSVQLRQNPGPGNSLGQIKFLFPNCCDCYLHDTPNKQLFEKVLRLFSHGCIRVEQALSLGEWILKDEGWTVEGFNAVLESQKTQSVHLSKPISIFIVYFTAWVDSDGIIQFRSDVYGKDKELKARL